jgi:hypothetical protein
MTGIERFILTFFDALVTRTQFEPDDFVIEVDSDARWASELESRGALVSNSSRSRPMCPVVRHNFGPQVTWPDRTAQYIYSVYDWGPFTDRDLSLKARAKWATGMLVAHARADVIHYLNSSLDERRPHLVPRPRATIVCYPDIPSRRHSALAEPAYALFVGTRSARKRTDQLALLAEQARIHVTLIGAGTETYASRFVTGLGRISEAGLDAAYTNAAALVMISTYEGFGIPVLEAAHRGIHSLVSGEVYDVLPDVLRAYCHVVDPTSAQSFADAYSRAVAARGRRLQTDFLGPLVDHYDNLARLT